MDLIDPWPDRSTSAERFYCAVSQRVSKRPIWLGDAAALKAALPPTIQRTAGSWRRRSASFTSSYPASRPNTDCRSNPTNAWRPFGELLARRRAEAEGIVEFAIGQQARIGSDDGAAKLERQSAVEIEPENAIG